MDTSNRAMGALLETILFFRIGEFLARVPFLMVTSFALDFILGTTFLDCYVKAILPPPRKVFCHHAFSVALTEMTTPRHDRLMASSSNTRQLGPTSTVRRKAPSATNMPLRKVCLIIMVTILPITQAVVWAATSVGELCFLQNNPAQLIETCASWHRGHVFNSIPTILGTVD